MSTKLDFVNWLTANILGLDAYYGIDKIMQWANNSIASGQYDGWFDQWQRGDLEKLKGDIIGTISGINPQYGNYMDKAKNSGDFMRRLIDTISQFVQLTENQITMWQGIVLESRTDQKMRDYAQGLLIAYQAQFKQASDTLSLYKKDLADGIAKGIYI